MKGSGITKQFKNYNDMGNCQMTLGYYNELPFISMSPVFEAQKGRDLSETPLQKGEKIFNHSSKIFFQLDLGDLIKIEEGIKFLEKEEADAFYFTHKNPIDGGKKTLEIGVDKDGDIYLKLSHIFTADGEKKKINIYFSCSSQDPESNMIFLKKGKEKNTEEFDLVFEEFKAFIINAKLVALNVVSPTKSKDDLKESNDDEDDDEKPSFFKKSNTKKPSAFKNRQTNNSDEEEEDEEKKLKPRKNKKVDSASDVFNDDDE